MERKWNNKKEAYSYSSNHKLYITNNGTAYDSRIATPLHLHAGLGR